MADPFKPKPLVDANLVTEFGGVEDMEQFKNEGPAQRDYLWVPKFSEARIARDEDLARFHRGEIKGKDVRTLDEGNVRWWRTVKGGGNEPDNSRLVHAKLEGYRAVTKDDIGPGKLIPEMPPGGQVAADGTIRSAGGDLQLGFAPKAIAARNAMRRKIKAEESVDGMELTDGGLGAVGKKIAGAEPYVTKQVGDRVIGGSK